MSLPPYSSPSSQLSISRLQAQSTSCKSPPQTLSRRPSAANRDGPNMQPSGDPMCRAASRIMAHRAGKRAQSSACESMRRRACFKRKPPPSKQTDSSPRTPSAYQSDKRTKKKKVRFQNSSSLIPVQRHVSCQRRPADRPKGSRRSGG